VTVSVRVVVTVTWSVTVTRSVVVSVTVRWGCVTSVVTVAVLPGVVTVVE